MTVCPPTAERGRLRLDEFAMEAEQLAGRGVESLRAPLLRLAALGEQLTQAAVPDDEVVGAYGAGSQNSVLDGRCPHTVQRLAVLQGRAARELVNEIAPAWQTMRTEWGS